MARRIHIAHFEMGDIPLDDRQSHHVRDVLRLEPGSEVELFDDAGNTAVATLIECGPGGVVARVRELNSIDRGSSLQWTIAAAVPKGDRADWMVEKLSELGTKTFIPLAAERSVVLPQGKNKIERWERIATESAKQSRRRGVMKIAPLTDLTALLPSVKPPGAWYLSTADGAVDVWTASQSLAMKHSTMLSVLIGPEGGWTDGEMARFNSAGLTPVTLGGTILRVETAAVAAAVVAGLISARAMVPKDDPVV